MRKILLFLAFFLASQLNVLAQNVITPGVGYADLKVGDDMDEVVRKMGKPQMTLSRSEEKANWERDGYNTKKKFTFQFDFDKIYKWDNDNKYAIWKIYSKKNKVVFINVSSYIYGEHIYKNINVSEQIEFFDNQAVMQKALGTNYYTDVDKSRSNYEYVYFELGVRFIFKRDILRNVYIFAPINDRATIKKFIKRLGWKKK